MSKTAMRVHFKCTQVALYLINITLSSSTVSFKSILCSFEKHDKCIHIQYH